MLRSLFLTLCLCPYLSHNERESERRGGVEREGEGRGEGERQTDRY